MTRENNLFLRVTLAFIMFHLMTITLMSQDKIAQNAAFGDEIDKYLHYTVPIINVSTLHNNFDEFIILDTRELEEYEVSHIPGAIYVGYDEFSEYSIPEGLNPDQKIVVYCSIGYRSEKIGEKLVAAGYKKVYNLYGSIFEWANYDFPLEDMNHQKTLNLHTYNKAWSKWISNPEIKKTW
ncbi:MAG TPA: rhodanese-like domain-containing protein [Saprospiraceae bacterium]|nr:rhodanese-like domain-containing protein [Saprospiraceae bacterium]